MKDLELLNHEPKQTTSGQNSAMASHRRRFDTYRGTIVDEFFSAVPGELRHVSKFFPRG